MKPKRILVLGASGFLGTHVRDLLEARPELGVGLYLDRPSRARALESPEGRWFRFDLLAGDAADYLAMLEAADADAIINCAGTTGGNASTMRHANVDIPARLVAAVTARGNGRLVHLGSSAEYGRQPQRTGVAESAVACPLSSYAAMKLEATGLVQVATARGSLQGCVLRVFNPLGPGTPHATLPGRAAGAILAAIDEGRTTIELGPLDAWRDFVDPRDVAAAAVDAATHPEPVPAILNVGAGRAVSVRAAIQRLASIAGYTGRIDETGFRSRRSASVDWQRADISLITQTLGWRPQHSLQESLEDLWQSTRQPARSS
jgi:nucleoside-diphosphate-sugar epimerase